VDLYVLVVYVVVWFSYI